MLRYILKFYVGFVVNDEKYINQNLISTKIATNHLNLLKFHHNVPDSLKWITDRERIGPALHLEFLGRHLNYVLTINF